MSRAPVFGIVGATGAVGRELLAILAARGVASDRIRPLASARSAGADIEYGDETLRVHGVDGGAFSGVDIALFSAGADAARVLAPAATAAGAVVIDNSSAFRTDPEVPLIVPEINGNLLTADRTTHGASADEPSASVIANPNCSTIILATAIDPLRRAFGIERLVVSTYQAASGAGAAAMHELRSQTGDVLAGRQAAPEVFAEPCAFNVFSHDTAVDAASGRNVEEQKVIDETRKIFDLPDLRMSVTCLRVPVLRAHAEAVNVTLASPASEADLREALRGGPGLVMVDDRDANDFPTSLKASGRDEILVGRVRPDESLPGDRSGWRGFDLLVCGDQLRKGAALNALQIADLLRERAVSKEVT